MKKKTLFMFLGVGGLFFLACMGGSAARFFVWDSFRRYEILPWAIPKADAIAVSLFKASICTGDSINDARSLLKYSGYIRAPLVENGLEEEDPFLAKADFVKPLLLTLPEFGIENWKIRNYYDDKNDDISDQIEVDQTMNTVAKALGMRKGQREIVLRRSSYGNFVSGYQGVRLTASGKNTKIGCWSKNRG